MVLLAWITLLSQLLRPYDERKEERGREAVSQSQVHRMIDDIVSLRRRLLSAIRGCDIKIGASREQRGQQVVRFSLGLRN